MIKKTTPLIALLLTILINANAQTSLPYYTGFDNISEQSGWKQYRKGDQGTYLWTYSTFGAYSAPNGLIHNYPVGGSVVTTDWFVSPPFDFSSGATIDSLRFAFTGFGMPGAGDTVALYLLQGSQDPALANDLTLLFDFRDTNYVNDNTWRILTAEPIAPAAGTSYLAFKYKTVNNWLDVRFDNLKISSNAATGVHKSLDDKNILIYPNPANDYIQIKFTDESLKNEKLFLKVLNLSGALLLERNISEGEKIKIEQPAGLFFYQIVNEKGVILKSDKLFIK